MRKWIALMLAICLALTCLPALALTREELEADARVKVEAGIALMAKEQSGWAKVMMEHTQVTSVAKEGAYVVVKVAFPAMKAGVSAGDRHNGDAPGYLQRAVAPALSLTETAAYTIRLSIKGKNDNLTLSWSDTRSLQGYRKKIGAQASSAAKTFETARVRSAVSDYLLPKAAAYPKQRPETAPAWSGLPEYCVQAAPSLGLTAEQAEGRLPAMLMLLDITQISAKESLAAVTLTLRARNWQGMLETAEAQARQAMDDMMGVPDLTREEIEGILTAQLPAACFDAYYGTQRRHMTETKVTVDLLSSVSEGVGSAKKLMDELAAYSAQVDAHVDSLMAYAATLDDYPTVELMDTSILEGSGQEGGAQVFVDTGKSDNHGYVCVRQQGRVVAKGFIHAGVRLWLPLALGLYEVYCSYGPIWYGERYIFGKEAFCGMLMLEVPKDGNLRLSLQDGGEGQAVTPLTYEAFCSAINMDEEE